MHLRGYVAHLRARNLAPSTIKATEEYLGCFLRGRDPLAATKRDVEGYLGELSGRCKPSTVWTAWRHLRGFFAWLHAEGDIESNPMANVRKPVVPATEVRALNGDEIRRLLATCSSTRRADRRDRALITLMLDTGLRLSEVARLRPEDVSDDNLVRVFGKGRKWRTVALGRIAATAMVRWMRQLPAGSEHLWVGAKGPLTPTGIRKAIERRGRAAGIDIHPHQLRHTFVDNWLRNGGSEVDLARLCGWTSTRMAERYAQHRADERALSAHKSIAPLDSLR